MSSEGDAGNQIGQNPAGWLVEVCSHLSTNDPPDNMTIYDKLRTIFAEGKVVSEDEKWEFISSFMEQISFAIKESERLIAEIYGAEKSNFTDAFTQVRELFFNLRFSQTVGEICKIFEDSKIVPALKMISAAISKDCRINSISAEDILIDAEALFLSIQGSDFDEKLKQWLLGLVGSIIKSIHDYQAYGFSNFNERVKIVIGELMIHQDIVATFRDKNPKAWAKFENFLVKASAVIRTSNAFIGLMANAPQMLSLTGIGGADGSDLPDAPN